MKTTPKPRPSERWESAYRKVRARPEPKDGTLSNDELIKVMKSQQVAGERLGFKTIGYTDFRGNPIEGKKLVEFALHHGAPASLPPIKKAITKAAEEDDQEFLVLVCGMLKKRPQQELTPQQVHPLQLFLVKEWVHFDVDLKLLHDAERSLCYYGDKGIAEICRLVLDEPQLKDNAVTQSRCRLGLKLPGKWLLSSTKFFQAPKDSKLLWANWDK